MSKPPIEYGHHFAEGMYSHEYRIPKNILLPTHAHHYSHMSILARGKVILSCEGKHTQLDATEFPQVVEVPAGKAHAILALEDSVWFCIHPEKLAMNCPVESPLLAASLTARKVA